MSRKKEREWKQQLIEALNAEAEEIEKRARSCQAELSEEKKQEMYRNIMERIQAEDSLEEKTAAEEKILPEKSRAAEKKASAGKSFWRHPLKLTGVLAAAAVLIFGMTLTSEGNRMYWLGKWKGLFGYDHVEQSNNGGDSIQTETSEQEAREQAWEKLGIAVPEFYYLPDEVDFIRATIEISEKRVIFQYTAEEGYIYLTAIKNNTEAAVRSGDPNGEYSEEITAGSGGEKLKVYILEDSSGGDGYKRYLGKWVYQNCGYEISGMKDKEALLEILRNMQFVQ